jgi:hypothetical protein
MGGYRIDCNNVLSHFLMDTQAMHQVNQVAKTERLDQEGHIGQVTTPKLPLLFKAQRQNNDRPPRPFRYNPPQRTPIVREDTGIDNRQTVWIVQK